MLRSMTGYSRAQIDHEGGSLAVSLKSTNHRFLDMQVRLPADLEALEPLVRRWVKEQVIRGHVEATVTIERPAAEELKLDRGLVKAYLTTLQKLRNEFGIGAEPDLVALLRVPGMVGAGNGGRQGQDLERIQTVLERATGEALRRLNEMRLREGESLQRDMQERLAHLRSLAEEVGKLVGRVPQSYQRRLEVRLRELLAGPEVDSTRLAQEVAYLASRSDVTEELTRFRSHLDQAEQLLAESSEAGKKFDFLFQEMNREANTLLSKTTDVPEVGAEVARQAIEMKTEIEKLREQAQNVE